MDSRIIPLLRNELLKATRRKLPYFGLFVVVLLSGVVYQVAGRISATATANAWGYVAFSMQLLFSDIGPIFIMVFSAMLIAEETGGGTIRALLSAPVFRWEVYLAKAAVGLLYALVLSAVALLSSAAFAFSHYQFSDISDAFGVIYSRGQVLRLFVVGFLLSWCPLTALVLSALLVSTVIRSPGAAVAVSIGTLYVVDLAKHLIGLEPYIFTRYIVYSWLGLQQISQGMDFEWAPEVWRMFSLTGACSIITFGTGMIIFVRQDLNHSA